MYINYTVPFAEISLAARRLVMATADSQVPACKSKAIPSLHGGLQSSKITKKKIHVLHNMRYWKCCLPFWHLFRKCAFTRINSISEIQSISRLVLAFNSSNVWGFVAYTLFFKCPIDKNRKPSR